MSKHAKILTMVSSKGGVGKTFLSLNFAYYEALHNKRVLLLDMDYQRDNSLLFPNADPTKMKNANIYRAFKHDSDDPRKPFPKNFKPVHVAKNIDLFSGSYDLNNVNKIMAKQQYEASFVLMNLIFHYKLTKKYDLIICDTHNSFEDPTINSLIISDYIFTPVIPNYFSIDSISSMIKILNSLKAKYYNVQLQKSNITAKLYFVGNMVKFNTKASHQFQQAIKKDPSFVAMFKYRELINKAVNKREDVFDYAKGNSNDENIVSDEIDPEFEKLARIVNP